MLFSEKDLIERDGKDIRETKELIESTSRLFLNTMDSIIALNKGILNQKSDKISLNSSGRLPSTSFPNNTGVDSIEVECIDEDMYDIYIFYDNGIEFEFIYDTLLGRRENSELLYDDLLELAQAHSQDLYNPVSKIKDALTYEFTAEDLKT